MKFNCGLSSYERYKLREKWHRWYAWHPVRICYVDDIHQMSRSYYRWLETVERKAYSYGGYIRWDYREIKGI